MNIKNKKRKGFTLIELIIVIVIFIIVGSVIFKNCDSIPIISSCNNKDSVSVTYSPPILPLSLSISSSGKLSVKIGKSWATPFGSFSAEWERQKIFYLEITLGNQTRFYPLGKKKLKLELPNSLEGNSSVRYDGEGNIRIIVPNPGKIHF